MADVRGLGRPSDEVRRFLLHEAGVVVIHGAAYGPGGEGTLRISFAAGGETLEHGLERLRDGLLRLSANESRKAPEMSLARTSRWSSSAAAASANPVDVPALRAALAEAVAGEVRFDRLSRALYSTDASVYQIVPLGVVLPEPTPDDRGRHAAGLRPLPGAAHRARRRHVAGRPGHRRRRASSIARSTSTACWRSTPRSAGCACSRAACSMI